MHTFTVNNFLVDLSVMACTVTLEYKVKGTYNLVFYLLVTHTRLLDSDFGLLPFGVYSFIIMTVTILGLRVFAFCLFVFFFFVLVGISGQRFWPHNLRKGSISSKACSPLMVTMTNIQQTYTYVRIS